MKPNSRFSNLYPLFILVFLAADIRFAAAATTARSEMEFLRNYYGTARETLRALFVEYEVVKSGRHAHHKLLAQHPDSLLVFTALDTNDHLWKDDYKQVWYGLHRGQYHRLEIKNRALDIHSLEDNEFPIELLGSDNYITGLGFWPLDQAHIPRLQGQFPIMFNDSEFLHGYVIRDTEERVDGRVCLKMEKPGLDLVWIDKVDLRIIRAREYRNGLNEPLLERIEFFDHREIDGLQIPFRMRRLVFDLDGTLGAGKYRKPRFTMELTVQKLHTCQSEMPSVEQILWDYPGLLVDVNGHASQVVPGGQCLLDQHAVWTRQRYFSSGSNQRSWRFGSWSDGVLIVGVLLFSVQMWRVVMPLVVGMRRAPTVHYPS